MKRYSRILIIAAAAIITFGGLWAFVGKHHCGQHNHYNSCSPSSTTQNK